jgi:hypothetical protein
MTGEFTAPEAAGSPYHFQLASSVGFAIRERPQGLSAATFIVTQPQRDESVMGRADPLDG